MVVAPFAVMGGVMSLILICWMVCERVGRTFVKGCEGMWVAKHWE